MVYKNRIVYLLLFQISCIQSAQPAYAIPVLVAPSEQVAPSLLRESLPNPHDAFVVPSRRGVATIQRRVLFPSDKVPDSPTEDVPSQETFRPGYFYIPVTEENDPQIESMLQNPESSCKVRMVEIDGVEYYRIYDHSLRKDQRVPDQELYDKEDATK